MSHAEERLTSVPETALLTLHARAREARRPDAIIDDPMAIKLADSIRSDFAKFGPPRQDVVLRALAFDTHTRRYLDRHPSATVVALGDGLQTSFWRIDAAVPGGKFRCCQWICRRSPIFGRGCCRLRPGCRCVLSPRWTTAGRNAWTPSAGCSSPPKDC